MRDDELDELIDSAVASYADARARPGLEERVLEQRVLARVTEEAGTAPARRMGLMWWAAAVPVAACLILIFALHRNAEQHAMHDLPPRVTPNANSQTMRVMPPEAIHAATIPGAGAHRWHTRDNRVAGSNGNIARPKLDLFPTPRPLNEQEQALIVLANQPPDVRKQALGKPEPSDAPLQISAIAIPPLSPPDEGKN